jgi:predicted nuclease of predicted toxin-antitoxin system
VKWLMDANVERAVVHGLRRLEPDTVWVSDRDATLPDPAVLDWALREGRVLVTGDKDFGALVVRAAVHPIGVVLLRLAGTGPEKAAYLAAIWPRLLPRVAGTFVVVGAGTLRHRRLDAGRAGVRRRPPG